MKTLAALVLLALAPSAFAATRGIVYSATGDPVAGAEVVAFRQMTAEDERERVLAGKARVAVGAATTDEKGAFSIDAKVAGVLELLVTREGFAPARQIVLADDEVAFELQTAKASTGRVTANGKPVANARVVAFAENTAVWEAKTDARGSYTIPEPKSWADSLAVIHPDFAIHHDEQPKLAIALKPGERVAGAVVTAKGAPAAGARVVHDGWVVGTADAEGKFVAAQVPAAATLLDARAGGAAGRAVRAKDAALTIRLGEARSVSGSVRDAEKRPVAGVVVSAWSSRGENVITAVTDEKGNYRVDGLESTDYNLAPAVPRLQFEHARVNLATVNTGRADFTATKATVIRGTVVDERKKPVAGAAVQWAMMQMPPLYASAVQNQGGAPARTGSDGRFELPEMMSGVHFGAHGTRLQLRVHALKRGLAAGVSEPIDLIGEQKPLTIVLHDGVPLAGLVVDGDGKPVAGAGVVALEEPFGAAALPIENLMTAGMGQPWVETGADGRFSFQVNQKPHDIGVWKESYAGARAGAVTPDGKALKIVLERGAELRGRIVQKGAPKPPMGMLMAEDDDGAQLVAQPEEDGTFAFKGVRPGQYTVRFMDMSGESVEKRVTAPAADVVIELAARGQVTGRVLDQVTGELLTVPYSVSLDDDSGFLSGDFAAGEPFTLSVDFGPARLKAVAAGYIGQTLETTVEEGKPAELTFRLTRGRRITGRIIDDSATPVAGASVSIEEDEDMRGAGQSAGDGTFVLDGAPVGAFKLAIRSPRHPETFVDVAADEADPHLDVVLPRGVAVRGRVVSSDGIPVENAQVMAMPVDGEGEYRDATSGTGGAFTIEGLTTGRYTFTAQNREGLESQPVTAEASTTAEIVLTLKPSQATGAVHGKVAGFLERKWQYGMVRADGQAETAMINRDGTFRLENVTAGEIELRAHGMTASGIAGTTPAVKVTVIAGADVEANLAFRDDVLVRGSVTENGQPVRGTEVRFWSDGGQWGARTNELGVYEIAGLESGMYDVSVGTHRKPFSTKYRVTGSATFDIAIDTGSVSGRVIDGDGKPVPGASIEAANASTREHAASGKTDANGAFNLSAPKGEFTVTASAEGFVAATQRVLSGAAPLVITLTRGDGLSVRLVDARTSKVLTGYVVATDANGAVYRPFAAKNGVHKLPLGPGTYRVSASADGLASQSLRVTVPAPGDVTMPLTPGGSLVIRTARSAAELVKLVLPNGEEYVQCHCNGIAEIRLTGNVTTVPHVAAGTYTLVVLDHDGRIVASQPVTIVEGQTVTAEIHVPE